MSATSNKISTTMPLMKKSHSKVSQVSVVTLSSSLHVAWRGNNPEKFKNLLSEEIDKETIEEFIENILDETNDDVFQSSGKVFWEIIFKSNLHKKTFQNGKSLIRLVAERGNSGVLSLLLQHEPNLRQTSKTGDNALHLLCSFKWDSDWKISGSVLNTKKNEESPYAKCMILLVNHAETDINALNDELITPIELAIAQENEKAVKILLSSKKKVYLGKCLGANHNNIISDMVLKKFRSLHSDDLGQSEDNAIISSKLRQLLRNKSEEEFKDTFSLAAKTNVTYVELSKKLNIFLQEATKYGLTAVVEFLLMHGADPSARDKWNDSRSAITVAYETNELKILGLLLRRASVMNFKLGNIKDKCDVEKINKEDERGNTALHYATFYGNETAMLDILDAGGFIGAENDRKRIPLTRIPAEVLKQFLDKKIKHALESKKLEFDCQFLKRESYSSTMLLKKMSENPEQRKLLNHPVLASFALKKWDKMRIIFITNFIFYTMLCSFITFNTLWASMKNSEFLNCTRIVQSLLLLILILRELFQAVIQKHHYFKQFENYLELAIISIGGYLSITCCNDIALCRHFGAVLVLISWLGFLLLIGRHPFFSVQVEMFRLVLTNFLKFLSVYFIMILAFALAFFVLFNDSSSEFSDISGSVFRTIIMISGEFDATDMPFLTSPFTSHIIFILFVFLVAIVLLNLLNGLAVYDTQKIKEDALLHTYVSRVKYLASLDELILGLPTYLNFLKLEERFSIGNYIINFDIKESDSTGIFGSFLNLLDKFRNYVNGLSVWDISQNAHQILADNAKSHIIPDDNAITLENLFKAVNKMQKQFKKMNVPKIPRVEAAQCRLRYLRTSKEKKNKSKRNMRDSINSNVRNYAGQYQIV